MMQQGMGMGGGYQPDPIGNRTPAGQRSDNEVLARVQDVSSKVEDAIETYTQVSRLLPVPWRKELMCSLFVLISRLWPGS